MSEANRDPVLHVIVKNLANGDVVAEAGLRPGDHAVVMAPPCELLEETRHDDYTQLTLKNAAGATQQPALPLWPDKLEDPLRKLLSLMVWESGCIARRLRELGRDIPRRAEDEQAFVLHWLIGELLRHGPEGVERAWATLIPPAVDPPPSSTTCL